MVFSEHPLRRWAVNELHLRRFAPVGRQCAIYQIVCIVEADQRDDEAHWLNDNRPAFGSWTLAARHGSGRLDSGIHFLWERHTEASTVTLILPDTVGKDEFEPYLDWLEAWPGAVIRATHVIVVPDSGGIEAHLDRLGMARADLVCSDVNGSLRVWSDFGIHEDGYGRALITAGDVEDGERGRIIQRLQELGNYRNLTLLGLPTVQGYAPQVDALELRLSDHARRVALGDEDDEKLLDELAGISSALELIRSETGFRLSATAAYAEVAADRLSSLAVEPVANFQSLTDFTERRMVPATRTCQVFSQRLGHIADRISGVMHMLDVRIDSRIKAQNLGLMQSMERSTQLQFRLQTLVEGLSVIAAAYYLVGLMAYVIKGVGALPSGWTVEVVIGVITLPVIALIYLLVRALRHRVLKGSENARDTGERR